MTSRSWKTLTLCLFLVVFPLGAQTPPMPDPAKLADLPAGLIRIDHLGIAVSDLDAAIQLYQSLGFSHDGNEEVPEQKVRTAFFSIGESHLELLAATSEDSVIGRFLAERGPGFHHVCYQVHDIEAALARYRAAGFRLVNETPVTGARGHLVAFIHPKSTGWVLIELLEKKP